MGSSKRIVQGVAWTTILNIVNGVYGFVSVPLLIANFGKSDYGLIGLAMSVNVYLRLIDLGFNSTNIRFFSNWLAKKDFENVSKLFQTSLSFYGSIGILNAVILLGISLFSNSIFNLTEEQDIIVKHLFYILSISAFISWFTSCFDQLVKANEYVGWTQKITLVPKALQILILVLTITCGFSIEWYYALTAFSMFVILPIMVRKIKELCPYVTFRPSFSMNIFKEVLPYSLNIFSFGLFQFSILNLRPVFLGMQSTPESITDYRILEGVVKVVLMLGGAFLGVVLPSASKVVANHDIEAQHKIAYQGTKFVSIAICFCCFGIISTSPEILTLYVGKEYVYLTLWLDLWLITTLTAHNQAISSLILAGSNIRAITFCTATSAVIGLLSCWFLIPEYGVGGTVIAYGVYCLIQLLFYYCYYWPIVMKLDSVRIFTRSFFPFVLIGATIALLCRMIEIDINIWGVFVAKGLMFSAIYAVLSTVLLGRHDRQILVGMISNKS